MNWTDLLTAAVGGLVGGSVSAFLTWLWTHQKWERTAKAFKTTARYLAQLILDPERATRLKEDKKGWLSGLVTPISGSSPGTSADSGELSGNARKEGPDLDLDRPAEDPT